MAFDRILNNIPDVIPRGKDQDKAIAAAQELRKHIRKFIGANPHESISLGQNCTVSWYLKKVEAKQNSYPFDWIMGSPRLVEDCLDDDFGTLLNKEHIFPIRNGSAAGHKLYHKKLFNHRNPIRSKQDYEYYERCIGRFRELMDSTRPAVFICLLMMEPERRKDWSTGFNGRIPFPKDQTQADYKKARKMIWGKNPNIKFIYIEQFTKGNFELNFKKVDEKIANIRFTSIGRSSGMKYRNKSDNAVIEEFFKAFSDVM